MDEQYELVEMLGRPALFTNNRVSNEVLPKGIYKYDLREGENLDFATVEPRVTVNHAGTLLLKEPLDFGKQGYLTLDEESSPNFLGQSMTVDEFIETELSQNENQGMGGIRL